MDSLIGTIRESLSRFTPGTWIEYSGEYISTDRLFFQFYLNRANNCLSYGAGFVRLPEDFHTDVNKKSLARTNSAAPKLDRVFYNL